MTYNNGTIYCIRNTVDDEIYVGSTTQPLCKIMAGHRLVLVPVKASPSIFHHQNQQQIYYYDIQNL